MTKMYEANYQTDPGNENQHGQPRTRKRLHLNRKILENHKI